MLSVCPAIQELVKLSPPTPHPNHSVVSLTYLNQVSSSLHIDSQTNMTSTLEYLTYLEGTKITLDAVTEAPLHFPAQTWVIAEKLGEDPCRLDHKDVSDGIGISYTLAKFLCYPAGPGNETKLAFMRIYQQVPIAGTEFKPSLRASQAVEEPENGELATLKFFLIHECEVVPKLLGYQKSKQKEDDMVLGGFVTYIIWEKVPGDSFDHLEFWLRPFNEREAIRDKLRRVFTYVCEALLW